MLSGKSGRFDQAATSGSATAASSPSVEMDSGVISRERWTAHSSLASSSNAPMSRVIASLGRTPRSRSRDTKRMHGVGVLAARQVVGPEPAGEQVGRGVPRKAVGAGAADEVLDPQQDVALGVAARRRPRYQADADGGAVPVERGVDPTAAVEPVGETGTGDVLDRAEDIGAGGAGAAACREADLDGGRRGGIVRGIAPLAPIEDGLCPCRPQGYWRRLSDQTVVGCALYIRYGFGKKRR